MQQLKTEYSLLYAKHDPVLCQYQFQSAKYADTPSKDDQSSG